MFLRPCIGGLFHSIYKDRRGGATLNEICLLVDIEKRRVAFLLQMGVS